MKRSYAVLQLQKHLMKNGNPDLVGVDACGVIAEMCVTFLEDELGMIPPCQEMYKWTHQLIGKGYEWDHE